MAIIKATNEHPLVTNEQQLHGHICDMYKIEVTMSLLVRSENVVPQQYIAYFQEMSWFVNFLRAHLRQYVA